VNATTLSVSIERAPREVYDFVSQPRNLPRWAAGLAQSVRPDGDGWIAETAQGPVHLRFAPSNTFGVLDHYVRPVAGREIAVPMRVVPNGAGSEVLITIFQQPEMTKAQYQEDLGLVQRDLERLRRVLEGAA
jgi:hypothetical protein